MIKRVKMLGILCLVFLSVAACSTNNIIGNPPDSKVQATEENMLAISRVIINNIGHIYSVESEEEARKIIERNIINDGVYYRGFLEFFDEDQGKYEDVSVELTNESVENLNPDNERTIGTILYKFDLKVSGIRQDGSTELIGEEEDLMIQVASYEGHFRLIEIRRQ
ncbi:hypothetical protein [Ornithinibacillus halophilus]|uniref:Uncharacterized protein n=1 Tax=Ornithinibacillus halophilus TaxID=930117 RepID=A0A1M5G4J7_9BACI|nr:hypothetical protein [Ornithinibacillus halophilus]SHF98564.1 hypothetical protein SAMN05216225_101161 [Ornithinibacillus halophilus]